MTAPHKGSARLYRSDAEYTEPGLELSPETRADIHSLLALLYGASRADELTDGVLRLLRVHDAHKLPAAHRRERGTDPGERFSEQDVILITYGDLIVSDDLSPLQTLARVADDHLDGLASIVHLLPFFPWSSDRGFSVVSYRLVDHRLGTWDDVAALSDRFRLMFDAVVNHVSRESRWFEEWRAGHPDYEDYFIAFDSPDAIPAEDLKKILRPRTSPLLSKTSTISGPKWVWTTFSEDQVDLNFTNPKVLLEILALLLYYVRRGADVIRLDAVTYLWKELGTQCAHLEQTHASIKLLRAALDIVAPHVALVTETNVPHTDNVSYFGSGGDEAQMVYNFSLPPLVLHTFQTGDATKLSHWASTLEPPSPSTHFLNFLSSHDGIGLMGARGILSEQEILDMCRRTEEHGGLVSMRSDPERGESPYELNITWYSALNRANAGEPLDLQIDRFIASRALALILKGVPGVYLPALIGSRNDTQAVERSHSYRDINRSTIHERVLRRLLGSPRTVTRRVSDRFLRLLRLRKEQPAFHPNSAQDVLGVGHGVFGLVRKPASGSPVLCLINVRDTEARVSIDVAGLGLDGDLHDVVGGADYRTEEGALDLRLAPYQVFWLTHARGRERAHA
jgi:sucrose phosphorylase